MEENVRHNVTLHFGQTWQLSDPRRLSAFRILDVHLDDAYVNVVQLYPNHGQVRTLAAEKFWQTGPKGYTRL